MSALKLCGASDATPGLFSERNLKCQLYSFGAPRFEWFMHIRQIRASGSAETCKRARYGTVQQGRPTLNPLAGACFTCPAAGLILPCLRMRAGQPAPCRVLHPRQGKRSPRPQDRRPSRAGTDGERTAQSQTSSGPKPSSAATNSRLSPQPVTPTASR